MNICIMTKTTFYTLNRKIKMIQSCIVYGRAKRLVNFEFTQLMAKLCSGRIFIHIADASEAVAESVVNKIVTSVIALDTKVYTKYYL